VNSLISKWRATVDDRNIRSPSRYDVGGCGTLRGKTREAAMYLSLCVLMATIAYGTAVGNCQVPQAGTDQVTFQSSTYSDFRQILAQGAATATVAVRANLGFPEEPKDRYPAVVIVHTIGGYLEANEGQLAAELRKSGFATLT
jgi:hypothetical protein